MIVRATSYNNTSMLNAITQQQNLLYDTYNKINTNQKFSNISENPIDSTTVININNQLQKLDDYEKNITNATAQINVQDSTFSLIVDKMQRINDLAIQAANGASGAEGIEACKEEIKQLKENIVNLANTEYNGIYIFSGANTTTSPYVLADDGSITYNGTPSTDETYLRRLEIADGVYVDLNIAGDSVFGSYSAGNPNATPPVAASGSGLFKVLGDLESALNEAPVDTTKITAQLDNIQNSIKNVSEIQSRFSASVTKMTMTQTNIDDTKLVLESQKQQVQEIDQATAISEFIKQNYAYQTSMQVFMQMQNQSLMNYM